MQKITPQQIKYICENMLGIDNWLPNLESLENSLDVYDVLSLCDSKLEIMYLLGVAYYIDRVSDFEFSKKADEGIPIWGYTIDYDNKTYPCLWFLEPWSAWRLPDILVEAGPSSMAFIPQIEINGLKRDFGVMYGNDNGSPQGDIHYIIEIDGYQVHKDRREQDKLRDSNTKNNSGKQLPIIRLLE